MPRSPSPPTDENPTAESHAADLENAFDLLEQLMQPESIRRITPRGALYHGFLKDEQDDDEFFPHPFGEGVCGDLHFVDEVTEEPCVKVILGENHEIRRLVAGEGMAIGSYPCVFHRTEYDYEV
jgi:cell division control protein 7